MTNFENVAVSPETLGAFLSSLPIATGPWDELFHRQFCDSCEAENCDAENCPHQAERSNPMWWLMQGTEDVQAVTRTYEVEIGGAKLAQLTFSVTTMPGFQKETHLESLLSRLAEYSRAFYLDAGVALKEEV